MSNLKYKHTAYTSAQWASLNPVIVENEIVIESDTKRTKIGNGISTYNELEYADANSVGNSLGSIKPTDAAPTLARNGNYTFSIGGAKPAWLTAEAGVTTVKAGDGVAVVYTAPSTYSYTHVNVAFGVEQVRSQSTGNVPSSKLLDDELAKVEVYNVTTRVPLTAGQFYTTTTARAAVPTNIKKLGLKITYATATGVWVEEQYIGSDVSEWGIVSNWDDSKLLSKRMTFSTSKNKFNHEDPTTIRGAYLGAAGAVKTSASYTITHYISVLAGETIICNKNAGGGALNWWYDSNKNIISSFNTASATAPENAAFVRFSLNVASTADISTANTQIEVGTISTTYEAYRLTISEDVIPSTIVRKTDIPNVSFLFDIVNLLNQSDADFLSDKYLKGTGVTGDIVATPKWYVSGYIAFTSDMVNLTASIDGIKASPANAYNCLYDSNKNLIASFTGTTASTLTWQTNVAYARFSFIGNESVKKQIQIGSTATAYQAYGEDTIKGKYIGDIGLPKAVTTPLGGYSQIYKSNAVTGSYTDSNFPQMIKGRNIVLFTGNFTTFSGLSINRGDYATNGYKLNIQSNSVIISQYNRTDITVTLTNTITSFIKVKIVEDKIFNSINITILTLGGIQTFNVTITNGLKGAFGFTTVVQMTNVIFSITNKSLKQPVWLFGDSYMDLIWSPIHTLTDSELMINGYGGMTSQASYADLIKCFKYSFPKVLIWTLGMNDTYLDFSTYVNSLIALSNIYGFTVVFYAPPTVPTRDKDSFLALLNSLNVRFINAYKAVGTNSAGSWYSGYLSADGVHPNSIGCNAIMMQYFVDCPEILNF